MPESATDYVDYYPSGWTETIHEAVYVEWIYDDPEVFVRLDGTGPTEGYVVTPVTGVNDRGEEFVTRPIDAYMRQQRSTWLRHSSTQSTGRRVGRTVRQNLAATRSVSPSARGAAPSSVFLLSKY